MLQREGLKKVDLSAIGWVDGSGRGKVHTQKTCSKNVFQVILRHFRQTFFHIWGGAPPLWALSTIPSQCLLAPPAYGLNFWGWVDVSDQNLDESTFVLKPFPKIIQNDFQLTFYTVNFHIKMKTLGCHDLPFSLSLNAKSFFFSFNTTPQETF